MVFCVHLGIQVSSIPKMAPKAIYGMESFRVRSHCFMKHRVTKNRTPDSNINTEGPLDGDKALVLDCGSLLLLAWPPGKPVPALTLCSGATEDII